LAPRPVPEGQQHHTALRANAGRHRLRRRRRVDAAYPARTWSRAVRRDRGNGVGHAEQVGAPRLRRRGDSALEDRRRAVIDIAAEPRSSLGEGPLWDHRVERMLWVDIADGGVNILTPSAGSNTRIELGENVGCLALTNQVDTVVAALRSGWHWLDLATGERRLITSLPAPASYRFNDGAVDAAGRFWTGTLEDGERKPVGE